MGSISVEASGYPGDGYSGIESNSSFQDYQRELGFAIFTFHVGFSTLFEFMSRASCLNFLKLSVLFSCLGTSITLESYGFYGVCVCLRFSSLLALLTAT